MAARESAKSKQVELMKLRGLAIGEIPDEGWANLASYSEMGCEDAAITSDTRVSIGYSPTLRPTRGEIMS